MTDNSRKRSRSRSPPRRAPRGSKGFRWEDSTRGKEDSHGRDEPGRRRDYRDRSPNRQGLRDGDGAGEGDRRDRGGDRHGRLRSPRPHDSGSKDHGSREKQAKDKGRKEKKAAVAPAAAGQEMIVVHVNDRLGTKSAIPCLPSDTIGQLKLMVAARIGRDSSQIMLRRQSERPFKDQLSLEDYGISNGVQLDLELDTGD